MQKLMLGSALLLFIYGFQLYTPQRTATLTIEIQANFSGKDLILEDHVYHLASGDSLTVDLVRFYLSSIQLTGSVQHYVEKASYHLIDAADNSSCKIVLQDVPIGHYHSLVFNLGTDSLVNVSGAMAGDLDPSLGMYWAWNSGFINVKLEGRSNSCPTRFKDFQFHIGGYMPPHQTVREISIPLDGFIVHENKENKVLLGVDLEKFFKRVDLKTDNQVMIPGPAAARMADYFLGVFSRKD